MDENKPKNIFEHADRLKKESSAKKVTQKVTPQKKEAFLPDISENLLDLHHDPEINSMLNKMYRMQDNIQLKLNEIYDSSGVSSKQITNFLNNPSNFPPDVWQKIQQQRDTLEKKIGDVLKSYVKKPKSGYISGKSDGVSKERKSKTLGARRNWIPM